MPNPQIKVAKYGDSYGGVFLVNIISKSFQGRFSYGSQPQFLRLFREAQGPDWGPNQESKWPRFDDIIVSNSLTGRMF